MARIRKRGRTSAFRNHSNAQGNQENQNGPRRSTRPRKPWKRMEVISLVERARLEEQQRAEAEEQRCVHARATNTTEAVHSNCNLDPGDEASDMSTSESEGEDNSAEINSDHDRYSGTCKLLRPSAPSTLAPVVNVVSPRPDRFCSILPLRLRLPSSGAVVAGTGNDIIFQRRRFPCIGQIGPSENLDKVVTRNGDTDPIARRNETIAVENTATAAIAKCNNEKLQDIISSTGNTIDVQLQSKPQPVIDLTHSDEPDVDILLLSSSAENLGVPLLPGNALEQVSESFCVYGSDGNKLHDRDEDKDEEYGENSDGNDDDKTRNIEDWIYRDPAAPSVTANPHYINRGETNDISVNILNSQPRDSLLTSMQISNRIPSRSPRRSPRPDSVAAAASSNFEFARDHGIFELQDASLRTSRTGGDRNDGEERGEIGILSFGEGPVVPPFAKTGPNELGKLFNLTQDGQLFDHSIPASNGKTEGHAQDGTVVTSTSGQDRPRMDIDAGIGYSTEPDPRVSYVKGERVEQGQRSEHISFKSMIHERATNLRGRHDKNAADRVGQLAIALAPVARLLLAGGTEAQAQQPAQTEEETADVALKRLWENEEVRKEEMRQVSRDEVRQTIGARDHPLSGLLQEVLDKKDNFPLSPLPSPAQPLLLAPFVESEPKPTSGKRKGSDEDVESNEQGQVAAQTSRPKKRTRLRLTRRRHDSLRAGASDHSKHCYVTKLSQLSALGLFSLGVVAAYVILIW